MSDRGFGDHSSKNVMKNPLLSTAVIGVSLDDLTHNAVLLPAVPSQELITRQDEQIGSQGCPLRQPEQNTSDLSSGDANSNLSRSHGLSNVPYVHRFDGPNLGDDRNAESGKPVQSKASVGAEDDFDVNEYFARLQGTRYVSAPLNSAQKENIGAEAEENLEEINLNEPEKAAADDVPHSLTADIAQNFSQLPTVLPQVASAVFSSFSNMLSMKSREHTPDEGGPVPDYRSHEPVDSGVPLMGVPDVVKDVAPQPKEPPTIGTASNYRITTRKKMYAPIPGLRSGDMSHNLPTYNPPMGLTNAPSFFTPDTSDATDNNNFNMSTEVAQSKLDYNIFGKTVAQNVESNVAVETTQNIPQEFSINVDQKQLAVSSALHDQTKSISFIEDKNKCDPDNIQSTETLAKCNEMDLIQPQKSHEMIINTPPAQSVMPASASNVSVIPPPPMFSNLPRSEGQNNLRSVLPPSIARRISASNPVIKPQAPPSLVPLHNIFVPDSNISTQSQPELNVANPEKSSAIPLMSNQLTNAPILNNNMTKFESKQLPPAEIFSVPSQYIPPTLFQAANTSTPAPGEVQHTKDSRKEFSAKLPFNISQPSDLSVTHLSQLNLDPPITNLAEELTSEIPLRAPNSDIFLRNISDITDIPSTSVPLPPPPVFINPNDISALSLKSKESRKPADQCENNAATDSSKIVTEPPKISNTQNFRMTKKRPQYYSGPIEGVGSISNNVKPTINPIQTNTFLGTLYTPQFPSESIPGNSETTLSNIGFPTKTAAFGITQSSTDITPSATSYPEFNINQSQINTNMQPEFSTAFDLSRQTTEFFDRPQQESKGFGIIGSLKSKLSSIDINKIQNTVTTFFDPAYNYTKMDATTKQENIPYDNFSQSGSTYSNQFTVTQDNLEIYVPSAEPASNVGYNYQMGKKSNVNIGPEDAFYAPSSYSYNYFDSQTSDTYTPSVYSNETNNNKYDPNATDAVSDFNYGISSNAQNIMKELEGENPKTLSSDDKEASSVLGSIQKFNFPTMSSNAILNFDPQHQPQSLFDSSHPPECKSYVGTDKECYPLTAHVEETRSNEYVEEKDAISKDSNPEEATCDSLEHKNLFGSNITKLDDSREAVNKEKKDVFNEHSKRESLTDSQNSAIKFFDKTTESSCLSLFSEPTPDFLHEATNSANDNRMKNRNRFENSQYNEFSFNENAANFFDTTVTDERNLVLAKEQEHENNDLNICETCREVNKHGEKEAENLTDQLIENITAPIQLSNPVEVPLTETNTPDVTRTDFEPDQCAEISHITEETIETIHVQAATELLDNINETGNIIKSYGWSTDDTPLTSSNVLIEHDYTFQPEDSNMGLFQNKCSFFDNMPTNASDEIKAEYKNSLDDAILPRQLSIPSAPPAEEEDTKSDESGLDVHSIEQDAKKDFPIFDEYVIDPSETDDDKIEYKEREKSSDDPIPDVDTFTNRVERYKKMEETHADHVDDVFESRKSSKSFELPTSSSPAMTIASYFDTGNYAVENHYRNSLTSPSNLNSFQFITQSSLMRVPPGFEDEFQRRLSLVSNEGFLTTDKDEFAKYIPDLAYQSNLSTALTANQLALNQNNSSSVETENILDKSSEKSHSESLGELPLPQTEAKLPDFASIFDGKRESANEENQPLSSSSFSELTPEKKLEKSADPSNEVISLPHSVNLPSDKPPAVAENSDVYDFSRLSSYFSSPTQADPSKSFFELSQSQNHYRQETVPLKDSSKIASDCSIVGNTTSMSSRNNPNDKTNIPHETLVANMNLIKDLTSTANIDFIPKEQTVRTINFFTVVYDDNSLNPVSSKGESKSVKNDNSNRLNADISSSNIHELVKTSSKSDNLLFTDSSPHCCNTETETVKEIDNNLDNLGSNKVKFRKSMNGNSSDASNGIDVMEKKKDDGGHSFTVNFDNYSLQEEKEDNVTIMTENRSSGEYSPVKHHWFYRVDQEDKSVWKGFSAVDSTALENAYNSPDLDENTLVPTDGGRFDVHVVGRLRTPVYWSEKPSNVMRCSWFYRGNSDARYVPYPESVAVKLEEEYKHGIRTSEWHRRLVLPEGEVVVMHGPSVMVHFLQGSAADAFSSSPQTAVRPRVVRRGCVESEIEDGEPSKVDHLVLLCHGVGSACDMRFRPVEEVVDDFRATSLQLLQSHYKNSYDRGIVGRIEVSLDRMQVLPVSWHSALHSGEAGVDRRLARVTLDSIPRLRSFTNDTVLDVLFYTSPVYCQTIIDTVCKELNRIYSLFKARNPSFDGGVSLGGHSLGSVILYDLLCHQTPEECPGPEKRYVNGSAGTGQPSVSYPQLIFHPDVLYALGSPIAIFECIRGVEQLGADFCLPTCKRFFNIFHPYDPIAYRIEPLINPQLKDVKPFQIPHHKGRKRMHLELKDTMARVGADIKQKLIESIRSTWSSMWRSQPPSERQLEKVVEEEMEKEQLTDEAKEEVVSDSEVQATAEMLGKLNGGRRVDYVLQEAPFEMINEYLFAMSSHVCYWESEDTMLLVLREVYSGRGVQPDGSRPQRTMTVQRTRPVLATETDDIKIIGSDSCTARQQLLAEKTRDKKEISFQ